MAAYQFVAHKFLCTCYDIQLWPRQPENKLTNHTLACCSFKSLCWAVTSILVIQEDWSGRGLNFASDGSFYTQVNMDSQYGRDYKGYQFKKTSYKREEVLKTSYKREDVQKTSSEREENCKSFYEREEV